MILHTYTDEDVRQAVTWREVMHDLPLAFADLLAGKAAIQARQRIDCGDWKLSGMGALWESRGVAGYKTYTSLAGQFNFLVNMFDLATGAHHVMPAAEITRCRTAAMTTWVAREIVNPGAKKLALFGLGIQGQAHLEALQSTLNFKEIAVVDTADVREKCEALARQHGIAVYQSSPSEAVADADLVVTITRSKQPVFDGAWLKPGASVCAVGTSLPSGSEIDATTRSRSQQVIVEWKPQSLIEAGEIVMGLADKSLDIHRIKDLPEMLARGVPWRKNADDIILFKGVGVGLSDLVTARLAVQR